MSKQIELALVSLIPTYGSDLPTTLVEHASSLLAQSRHLASTLKAEEEIARSYACANIACDRLKLQLDLPTVEPRPPIPPRVYKRLYTHLDNILPNSSSAGRRVRTPSSKRHDLRDSPASSQKRPLPSRGTPTKESSLAQFRKQTGSAAGTPTKTNGQAHANVKESELYPWVQPVIRRLCAGSGDRKLAPSMLAGMEAILIPGGRRTTDEWVTKNAAALCAAIIFFVAVGVKEITPEQAVHRDVYVPTRKEILDQLASARTEVVAKGLDEDILWEGWTDLKTKDFDAAVQKVTERGWLDADWYRGIADVANISRPQDLDMMDADDGEESTQMQGQRADTMFQEKYNYLSEARRAEYKTWKEAMLAKIAQLSSSIQ